MPKVPWISEGAEKVIADWEKVTGKVRQGTDANKQFTRAQQELGNMANRVSRDLETGQERYNRKLSEAKVLVNANKLSAEDYRRQVGRLKNELNAAGGAQERSFGAKVLGNIQSFALGFVGIHQAFAAIRSEMEAIRLESEKTTGAQLTSAQARDVLKRNVPTEEGAAVEARAEQLAKDLRLPQNIVDKALAESISASGGDIEKAFARTKVAARFLKTSPEEVGAFSGSLGDIAKSTGDPDTLRNLGFLIQVGKASRVANAQAQAATIPQSLGAMATAGIPSQEGGAFFAAISEFSADFQGNITKSALVAMSQSLNKFFDKHVEEGTFDAAAVDEFDERLAALRSDPELAKQFVTKGQFGRGQAAAHIRRFFTDPDAEVVQTFEAHRRGFGTPEEQRQEAIAKLEYLDRGRFATAAATERVIASGSEQFRLGKDAELTKESRDEVIQRIRELRGPFPGPGVLMRTGLTMSRDEAISELDIGLHAARPLSATMRAEAGNEDAKALVENTREMIDELRRLNQTQEDQSRNGNLGRQE